MLQLKLWAKLDLGTASNSLRAAVIDFFSKQGGVWDFKVSFSYLAPMLVEDASVPWPEDESPYVMVGRICSTRGFRN